MSFTIITFILLKYASYPYSDYTIRIIFIFCSGHYVTCVVSFTSTFCINLGIAQIIFVAGIDQSASDHVPIHCKVIAVLFHYFFFVSFMWMLMEGVVLYIMLVKVFISDTIKKRSMLAFTIASYGIPLLYIGALTIPLGFVILKNQDNYGYHTA